MKPYWEKRLKQYEKYQAGTWTGKNVDKMLEEVFRIKGLLIKQRDYQAMEYYVTKGYSGNRFSKFFARTSKGTIKFAKNIPSELKQQFTERIFEDVNEVMSDDFESKTGFEDWVSAKTGQDITFTNKEWADIQDIAEQRRQEGQSYRDSLYNVLEDISRSYNMTFDMDSLIKAATNGDAIAQIVLAKINADTVNRYLLTLDYGEIRKLAHNGDANAQAIYGKIEKALAGLYEDRYTEIEDIDFRKSMINQERNAVSQTRDYYIQNNQSIPAEVTDRLDSLSEDLIIQNVKKMKTYEQLYKARNTLEKVYEEYAGSTYTAEGFEKWLSSINPLFSKNWNG